VAPPEWPLPTKTINKVASCVWYVYVWIGFIPEIHMEQAQEALLKIAIIVVWLPQGDIQTPDGVA
jgi:hypothetical protein